MQIFQAVQIFFDSIGFSRKELFNRKTIINFAIWFPANISLLVFIFHEANNTLDYMESIYFGCASIGITISAIHTIFTRKKLFSFFDKSNEFINESK